MKLVSDFALLDVTKGRKALAKNIEKGVSVKVVITGEVHRIWGSDDGESQEFEVSVSKLKIIDGEKQ